MHGATCIVFEQQCGSQKHGLVRGACFHVADITNDERSSVGGVSSSRQLHLTFHYPVQVRILESGHIALGMAPSLQIYSARAIDDNDTIIVRYGIIFAPFHLHKPMLTCIDLPPDFVPLLRRPELYHQSWISFFLILLLVLALLPFCIRLYHIFLDPRRGSEQTSWSAVGWQVIFIFCFCLYSEFLNSCASYH
jgi:hypothetical protein